MTGYEPPMTLHTMREQLAAQSRWASVHQSIVVRRQSDTSYSHIVRRRADGSRVISWDSESELGKELSAVLESAALDFETRFGRKPGPNDPLVISPSADEPTAMSLDDWNSELDELIDRAVEIGIRTEPLRAWRELGYIVTDMNMHLFSSDEVRIYMDTVRRFGAETYSNPG